MRNRLLMLISACLYYSGLVTLMRWWVRHTNSCVIILNYHQASGGDLRSHFLYLRNHFRLLHLETALNELYIPHKEGSRWKNTRSTALVVTFDDGYDDNYTQAFALARELEIPITIFLISEYTECGQSFWWLDRLIRHACVHDVYIAGRIYHLDQQVERKALAETITSRMSAATSVTEQEEFLATVRVALDVPVSVMLQEEPAQLLTWTQVKEMEESKWVSFGSHTLHHPILSYLSDQHEIQQEVEESRVMLEQKLGHTVCTFAYPYGRPEHIGDNGLRAVRNAGYEWAVTTIPGFNTAQNEKLLLRRIFVDTHQHWLIIAAKTSGLLNIVYWIALLPARIKALPLLHPHS